MRVCPSCHSLEAARHCPRCGLDLEAGAGPLFLCTLGWSRSKEYEGILSRFTGEPGYACRETAEEILHQVPLSDLPAVEDLVTRYGRAMLWKETRLESGGGRVFDLHGPVGVCFLRRILESSAPCQRDEPCPFLGPMAPSGEGLVGALQLAAHLLARPEALGCPYGWPLIRRAARGILTDPELGPFVAARALSALGEGRILLDERGHFTPRRADPACRYEVKVPAHLPQGATWAAMSGDLELAVVDDQLRTYPDGERVAPWPAASLVAPTERGRHVAVPPPQSLEPGFLVFGPGVEPVRCGPFPLPFAVDPAVRHVAFVTAPGQEESPQVVLVVLVDQVGEPFWRRLHAWPAPAGVRQLVTDSEAVAILDESGEVSVFRGGRPTSRAAFPGCLQIAFAGPDVLAALWEEGARLTLWRSDERREDFHLLLPASSLHPTCAGNLVCVCPGRITEISPGGGILDFRCGSALWMSARGYMERDGAGFTWHVLDQTPLGDGYWEATPAVMKVAALPAGAELTGPRAGLLLEVVSYFLSSELPRLEPGGWTRLVDGAPPKVRRELAALLRDFPWLERYDGPPGEWPVAETALDEFHVL